jgi:hypothetical protein
MGICRKRHRLALKLARSCAAVDELNDRIKYAGKKYVSLLKQARSAERRAARLFHDHVMGHGCVSL